MGIVTFSPKQDGTGDPTPTNVRPIHPGLVLKSKNLFNVNVPESTPSDTSSWDPTAKRIFTPSTLIIGTSGTNYYSPTAAFYSIDGNVLTINTKGGYGIGYAFKLIQSKTYTIGYQLGSDDSVIVGVSSYTKDGTFTKISESINNGGHFTVPNDSDIILLTFKASSVSYEKNINVYNIQLELGSTATEYEPYYNMEIYGGYVNFDTGELVGEWNFKHLIGSDFQSISNGRQGNAPYMPYTYRITDAKALAGSEYKNSMVSDKMRPLTASGGYANIYEGYMNDAQRFLFGAPEDLSTIDVARSWVDEIGGIDIIYQLDTSITYNLTASQLTQAYNQLVPVSPVMLERRRRMIVGCDPEVPPQYKRVEYIQAKNVAYIATNYIPTRYDEFDVEFMIDMYSSSFIGLFSAGTDTYQLVYLLSNTGDGYSYLRYFSTGASGVHLNLLLDTWYKLTLSANGLMSVNGISRNYSYENEVSGNNNNMYIFRRRNTNNPFIGKLKSFKVTNDGTLKLNLVPCVRISDDVAGVYDTVSKTFYPSASTAEEFTPGRTMY